MWTRDKRWQSAQIEKILEYLRAYSTLFFHEEKSFQDLILPGVTYGKWACS
jgi:hypothetical protein